MYRAYFRGHRGVVRYVHTVTSPDFVHWSKPVYLKFTTDVSRLSGKPIRLRFVLRDADLYSFRFLTDESR